jgi:hypothetical protein
LLHAESSLETRLSSQIQPASTYLGTVSEAEKKLIITNLATTLRKHVAFRSDGTESSYYESREGRQSIEWMSLRINKLAVAPLTDADKTRGVTKRIQAQLAYDSCRLSDPNTDTWGVWGIKCHPLFPPAINFEWVGGQLVVDGGMHLDKFNPGPMTIQAGSAKPVVAQNTTVTTVESAPAITSSVSPKAPSPQGAILKASASTNSLPPGMTRQ